MKSNILKYMVATGVALGLAATVQATAINGSIGFAGTYMANGETIAGNLSTAQNMTILTTSIFTATGDLAGAALGGFASPIGVNGNPPTIGQLWNVTVGSTLYYFTVSSQTQDLTSANGIHLTGIGTLSDGTPAHDTAGTWQLGFGNDGASFTWQSTTASALPDGGLTVMLLGAALSGLALIRRKLA
jgi:hypothetical protein